MIDGQRGHAEFAFHEAVEQLCVVHVEVLVKSSERVWEKDRLQIPVRSSKVKNCISSSSLVWTSFLLTGHPFFSSVGLPPDPSSMDSIT